MKAVVLSEINKKLDVQDVDEPEISPNEVLVEQNITGICYRDILTQKGFFPRVHLPIVPGHEIAGRIVKKGDAVKGFKVGDRVSSLIYVPCGKCEFCLSGSENLCPYKRTFGEMMNGGYEKYVNIPENALIKVPDGVTDADATIAACVTGMIIHALSRLGKVQEGQNVLITGAGGGVGTHAIQIAKALGAHVIAETSSPWKSEQLYRLGAEHVVTGDDFNKEIKKITGDGVHAVLESVGLPTFEKALRSLRVGGRMIVIGNVDPRPVTLPLGLIILKGNIIKGSISSTREDVARALDLNRTGRVHATIYKTVNLPEVNDAYEDMLAKRSLGRILLKL